MRSTGNASSIRARRRPLRRPSMTVWRAVPSTNDASRSGSRTAPCAQLLQHHDEHVLHEVRGRGLDAQVLEPVEPDPRAEPAAKLGLGGGVPVGRAADDPPRERGVVIRVRSLEAHARSIRGGVLQRKHARRCNDSPGRYTSMLSHFNEGRPLMITNTQSGTNIARNRRRHLPHQHARGAAGRGRVQLQSVPDRRRRADAVPHGPAEAVPARQRGDRAPCMPVERLQYVGALALRGRRMRRAERVPRGRAERRARLRPDRGAGRRSTTSPTARRARSPTARSSRSAATRCAGSTRRTCRTRGSAASCSTRRRARSSAAICSRKAAPATSPLTEADILGPERSVP